MDIGQMMMVSPVPLAPVSQVNATEALPVSAAQGTELKGLFAGLLKDVNSFPFSKLVTDAAITGAENEAVVTGEASKAVGLKFDKTILTIETTEPSTTVVASKNDPKATEESAGQLPQDVALLMAGSLNIQPLQNGRMPERQKDDPVRIEVTETQQISAIRINHHQDLDGVHQPITRSNEVIQNELTAADLKTAAQSFPLGGSQAESAAKPETISAVKEEGLTESKLAVTEGGAAKIDVGPAIKRSGFENQAAGREFKDAVQTDKIVVQSGSVDDSVVTAQVTEKQPALKSFGSSQGQTVTNAPIATAPIATQTTTLPLAETALLNSEVVAITAPLSDQAAPPQAGIRLVHSSAVTHPQAAVVMDQVSKKTDGREEVTIKQQLDLTNQKSLEGAAFGVQKVTASAGAENEVLGDAKKGTGEQGLSEQFALSSPTQHAKADAKHIETASAAKESTRSDLPENVVRQVKDLFVSREIKSGNEQMTLKLSPEHLGELTLSFKMENQQLKVQIIAENQSVKDALLQNSENLKESLSRQNIKMESFEVLTNSGQRGFEQNDRGWKQLAQQQFTPGTLAYGSRYAVSEVNTDALPTYGRSQQYAMVDVHF